MDNMIRVEGLRFAYPPLAAGTPAPWVLDGLDLQVDEGEWLAVMGASDVGKTTLCLLLAGLAPHLTGGSLQGRVVVSGSDTRELRPPALAGTVGLLFQEPEAQLFNPTAEAEVAWGLENLGLSRPEMQARIDEVLALLHLESVRLRAPSGLSGGEKKRLALAAVLAMRPPVLILDEPMGGLDPAGRAQVLAALASLRRDRSVTIVMAESDPEAVSAFADRLAILHEGRIVREAPPHELFRDPEDLARAGVAAPDLARLAAALSRHSGPVYRFRTVEEAYADLRPLLAPRRAAAPPLQQAAQPVPAAPGGSGASLETQGVWFGYVEGSPVLRGIDLAVPAGQFVALVGANGSGKTTLVKQFNGLLRPGRGVVRVDGVDTARRPVGELARSVGFLFQHPEQQVFCPSVRREVAFGPANLGFSQAEVERRVDGALHRFDLLGVADRPPAILSYGLRRRVTLATLAALDPPALVLDEPTVGLDARGLSETLEWLAELHGLGRTIVLVTHDMALVARHAQRMIVLDAGQVLADGPPSEVFRQPLLLARASLALPPLLALSQMLEPWGLPPGCTTVEDLVEQLAPPPEGAP